MIFIIDSNILLSALIKDSITRKIIVESEWTFYYPELAFHEIRKYKGLVMEKSGMNEEEYNNILNMLLKHIILIPEEQFLKNLQEANNILGKIDADDVVFLAAAMSIENSKIWSNDNHFQQQNNVKTLKTEQIAKLFG